MWSFWLAFCDCGIHSGGHGIVVLTSSVFPLMDEDKRLVHASWWEALAVEKNRDLLWWAGQCSINLNPPFCPWVRLCSLPVSCLAWCSPVLEPEVSVVELQAVWWGWRLPPRRGSMATRPCLPRLWLPAPLTARQAALDPRLHTGRCSSSALK